MTLAGEHQQIAATLLTSADGVLDGAGALLRITRAEARHKTRPRRR